MVFKFKWGIVFWSRIDWLGKRSHVSTDTRWVKLARDCVKLTDWFSFYQPILNICRFCVREYGGFPLALISCSFTSKGRFRKFRQFFADRHVATLCWSFVQAVLLQEFVRISELLLCIMRTLGQWRSTCIVLTIDHIFIISWGRLFINYLSRFFNVTHLLFVF